MRDDLDDPTNPNGGGEGGLPVLRSRPGILLRPARRRAAVAARLFDQGSQGDDAGRRNKRLRAQNSASDGDIFPAMFREAGLRPLIGKRSWGGVVGITNRGTLIDGGAVFVPEFGFVSAKGEWMIEGYGVDPDIEVENDPRSVIEGKDPQLERAVNELMSRLKAQPTALPARPRPSKPSET
jgi:Peptidase family S41